MTTLADAVIELRALLRETRLIAAEVMPPDLWKKTGDALDYRFVEPPAHRAATSNTRDPTLRELQVQLPWTVHYHRDFRSSPMSHKDFGHALLHVQKAAGKLASVVNDAEHGGHAFAAADVDRFVADFVVCALRMANTCPGRTIDLQRAVEERIQAKNATELQRVPQ